MSMPGFVIRPLNAEDRTWVARWTIDHWGAEQVVTTSGIYRPHELPGFAVIHDRNCIGLLTYHIEQDSCEIVTLDSSRPNCGIGTALIEQVKAKALAAGCHRLWLITTNDNLHALGFYQRRGFAFAAIYRDILNEWRKLKPEIPLTGMDGIPLRDAIELEMRLQTH